jgi:hypothetical protein
VVSGEIAWLEFAAISNHNCLVMMGTGWIRGAGLWGVAATLAMTPAAAPAQDRQAPAGPLSGVVQFLQSVPAGLTGGRTSLLPPANSPVPPGAIPGIANSPPQSLAPPPVPGPVLAPPAALPIPTPAPAINAPAGIPLALAARYGREAAQPINAGLVWRVYPTRPEAGGVYRPVKEDRNPTPSFNLPAGDYVVHVSFGLASATKNVRLRSEAVREVIDLPAGGLRIEGRVGDARIPAGQIAFDVYSGSQFDSTDRRPIVQNVMTGEMVLVPEGTYYIVSNYGDSNSIVRSDIRVQSGRLTDVTVTHRAAAITLKLVGEPGGEALANTAWSVLTKGGDTVKESIGAFPKVILAEGDYQVVARNDGKTYERSLKVINGVDGEIEVLAR